jgi:leucyl-tRNA synthetase
LANEQVDANGHSWRSGAKVEQRLLKQWFLRITEFAEELNTGLSELRKAPWIWPENVLRMQKNWLKKSEGHRVTFKVQYDHSSPPDEEITVFTTRLDTLFGVQYIALAVDHPIVQTLSESDQDLMDFLEICQREPEPNMLGYRLEGITAISPLTEVGVDRFPLPIFVTPYVISGYGTGSVMGVPAHDSRDFNFWKHKGLSQEPIFVIHPDPKLDTRSTSENGSSAFTEWGYLNGNCAKYQGLHTSVAKERLYEDLSRSGSVEKATMWGLRDWLISRQRYWGTPIPIIHCNSCGAVPVPGKDLPVELPPLPAGIFKGRGGNPLDQIPEWVNTSCPKCGEAAKRETDTMDTFMDSSWYFFRFTDPHNTSTPFSPDKARVSMPVNLYIGGIEHAILHLLYARFITKFLAKSGFWNPQQLAEPFQRLITQGMVHGRTYSDPKTGRFLRPDEVNISDPANPKIIASGATPKVSYEKMSKSKYNGVDPQSCIAKYGADATRAHILFGANETEVLEWNEQPIVGILRSSLSRQGSLAYEATRSNPSSNFPKDKYTSAEIELLQATRTAVANITQKLEAVSGLNTVVSDLLKLAKALDAAHLGLNVSDPEKAVDAGTFAKCTSVLIRLMAPVVPAWAEEAWYVGHGGPVDRIRVPEGVRSVFEEPWPLEEEVSVEGTAHKAETAVLMVNGRRFGEVVVPCPPQSLLSLDKAGKNIPDSLSDWYVKEALEKTEIGRKCWEKYGAKVKRTIVVRMGGEKGGVIINLAVQDKKKMEKTNK